MLLVTYLGFIFEDGLGKMVVIEVRGYNPWRWELFHPLLKNRKVMQLYMHNSNLFCVHIQYLYANPKAFGISKIL